METKFRGQRVSDKEWVYGYLLESKYKTEIICNETEACRHPIGYAKCDRDGEMYCSFCNANLAYVKNDKEPDTIWDYIEVIPETVGQFTGLKDKEGTEIYEKDPIKATLYGFLYPIELEGIVVFKNGSFGIEAKYDGKLEFKSFSDCETEKNIQVIGNKWEEK